MTTLQEAAMRKALEALDKSIKFANAIGIQNWNTVAMTCHDAIAALRTALAQQGEPVAWLHTATNQAFTNEPPPGLKARCLPLYTAAPAPQPAQEPVKFLANGTRFKLSLDDEGKVSCFWNRKELDGRWVALVAAEDNCHLQSAQPVAPKKLQDTPTDAELARYKRMFEAACVALGEIGDALGCDPNEGGAEPILDAIAELKKSQPVAPQPDQEFQLAAMSDLYEFQQLTGCDSPGQLRLKQSAQPVAQPLTDDEITAVYKASYPKYDIRSSPDEVVAFVRAIEAAHGITK